jgi:hypothetical protein
LIISVRCDVAHPRKRLVAAALNDLEVPHLNPRHSKVRDLELDPDWRLPGVLALLLLVGVHVAGRNARQAKVRPHQILAPSVELLDVPDDGILVGEVGDGPDRRLEGGAVDVGGDRDNDFDVVGDRPALELGPGLDHVLDARPLVRLDDGLHPNEGLDVGVEPVRHEIELPVGRDEGNGSVVLEPGQADALVELDVLELHGLALGLVGPAGRLEHELVVQAELELGHARKERLHLDGAENFRVQDGAVRGDEKVELLHHVEKDLVLLVLDALRPPAHGVGERHGGLASKVFRHPICVLRDEGSQYGRIQGLGNPVVHGLVQELVNDDKVISDALLLQRPEVILKDVGELEEERQDQRDVGIARRHSAQVQIRKLVHTKKRRAR